MVPKDNQYKMVSKLKPGKVILPVVIGLAVLGWLINRDIDAGIMREIVFTWKSVFWIIVAFMFVAIRTFSYMARLRILTDNDISWLQSLRITLLWEFTSAITPSTVGGTGFAVVFLHKEGITLGRSTSVVLATSFLDELYFVVLFPILLLIMGGKTIFITSLHGTGFSLLNNLVFIALAGYAIILAWVLLVGYGLFINPVAIKKIIISFFGLPFIRKWKEQAIKAGDDIVKSSIDLKKKSVSFWGKALFATFISWTARYLVVNAILVSFFKISDHLLIFTRQLVMWIMMIVSPTPGGSGFAELILGRYLSDLIPVNQSSAGGVALAMALIWRIISYYPFLLAGVLIIPGWIARKFVIKGIK
jgi:glycosyltransferase 2 family protein